MSDPSRNDEHAHGLGRSPEASWLIGIVLGGLIVILLVAAYAIGWHRGRDSERATAGQPTEQRSGSGTTTPQEKTAAGGPGKQLFSQNCGSCHTLEAAGTTGSVGPNLDQLEPSQQAVLAAIGNGGSGSGGMPKDLLSGKQADEVAQFVSRASGGS
ncbi:MAG: cytochrome c [Phycisphaeraceae bacterium]